MPTELPGISRVLVVDDDKEARQGYSYPLADMGLRPVLQETRLDSLDTFVEKLPSRVDAVFSDFRLQIRTNYSRYDGDRLVAKCYDHHIPAILCSAFTDIDQYISRVYMRRIPALLRTNSPDPEQVSEGFRCCLDEFSGAFRPTRRPWRTLVRVYDVDVEQKAVHVVIPGWWAQEKLRINLVDVPPRLRKALMPGARLHAQVNLGAASYSELYFSDWEAA